MLDRPTHSRVVVNARFIDQPITGVQRFALQICLHLKDILPSVEFVAPRAHEGTSTSPHGLPLKRIGSLSGHAWEQISLPRYLREAGSPILINLCNTAPILYRNQIVTHHDITYIRYPASFSAHFRAFYRLITPLFLRKSHSAVTVSAFSKREICSHFKIPESKVIVVPNATDAQFKPAPSNQAHSPYFLAVSSPVFHKNFDRVIAAYSKLTKQSGIELRIVGSASGVFASTRPQKLPEGVIFMGRVTDTELVSLYSNAVGFIFPSLYEGFGIPPLEAQACGCPVLAARIQPFDETLGDSACYFDPYDVDDIADCMTRVASNPLLRSELIARGTSNVLRYSWHRSAQLVAGLASRIV